MKKTLLKLIDRVALADAVNDLLVLRLNATGEARYVGEEARKKLSSLFHGHKEHLRRKWESTREKQKGRLKAFWESEAEKHAGSIAEGERILNGSETSQVPA